MAHPKPLHIVPTRLLDYQPATLRTRATLTFETHEGADVTLYLPESVRDTLRERLNQEVWTGIGRTPRRIEEVPRD